jgi:transcriptional accessory protein Tex/SPT6
VLSADAQLEVRIEKIDQPNKRISLDLAGNEKENSANEKDELKDYMAKAPEMMGTLGDVFKKAGKKR